MLKYNRDSKGERHVLVNGVLMVKQGKREDDEHKRTKPAKSSTIGC